MTDSYYWVKIGNSAVLKRIIHSRIMGFPNLSEEICKITPELYRKLKELMENE